MRPAAAASPPDPLKRIEPSRKRAGGGSHPGYIVAVLVILLILILAVVYLARPAGPAAGTSSVTDVDGNVTANPAGVTTGDGSWTYSTDDKGQGRTSYFATTTSLNSVRQNPPYDANTTMTLTIQKTPTSATEILLTISSGQLMCPSYQGCTGSVRFDDGPPQRLNFIGTADDASETIFVDGSKSFLYDLKTSRKMTIEKPLHGAGAAQFDFDVSGLKWDH